MALNQTTRKKIARLERKLKAVDRKVNKAGNRLWKLTKIYADIRMKLGEKVTEISFNYDEPFE